MPSMKQPPVTLGLLLGSPTNHCCSREPSHPLPQGTAGPCPHTALWELRSHRRVVAGPLRPSKGLPVTDALVWGGTGWPYCPEESTLLEHRAGPAALPSGVWEGKPNRNLRGPGGAWEPYRTCVKHQRVGESSISHPRHQIHAAGCLLRAALADRDAWAQLGIACPAVTPG